MQYADAMRCNTLCLAVGLGRLLEAGLLELFRHVGSSVLLLLQLGFSGNLAVHTAVLDSGLLGGVSGTVDGGLFRLEAVNLLLGLLDVLDRALAINLNQEKAFNSPLRSWRPGSSSTR